MSNPTLEEFSKFSQFIVTPVIGLLLAENDRFNQRHSVLTQFRKDCLVCEVVGPGFDAADITRGRVSPHERFVIRRRNINDQMNEFSPVDIEKHTVVNQIDYRRSRMLRYGVILSILNKGLGVAGSAKDLKAADIKKVSTYLKNRGAGIPGTYEPLGFETLRYLYEYLEPLSTFREYFREKFKLDVDNHVLSSSFLKKHGLIFWDLYGPNKYRPK